jgi:hypothetical protein
MERRFRATDRHPSPGWCHWEIGQELVQGTDCHAYFSAEPSPVWLVVKKGVEISFCRAAPAKIFRQVRGASRARPEARRL